MPSFNKSQIVTWPLQLNTFTFSLISGHHSGEADFPKIKERETGDHWTIETQLRKTGQSEGFSKSTSCMMRTGI
jgi:hypothetical protein